MSKTLSTALSLIVLAAAAVLGYYMAKSHITAGIYRDRLVTLGREHQALREQYNEAVRKTAVTELLVENGTVCVSIRTAEGEIKQVPTPYKPSSEIYVDFVVLDGRLWIRRVFDENTAPDQGVVIDPALVEVDWMAKSEGHGKAAYRRLTDGRWAVTVTGDGSLGLARVGDNVEIDLITAPPVRDYEPVEEKTKAEVDDIGPLDVIKHIVTP